MKEHTVKLFRWVIGISIVGIILFWVITDWVNITSNFMSNLSPQGRFLIGMLIAGAVGIWHFIKDIIHIIFSTKFLLVVIAAGIWSCYGALSDIYKSIWNVRNQGF